MKRNNKIIYVIGSIIALVIVSIIIGVFVVKKPSGSEQKPLTPLNKLSDKELEKCLLEDFSRRLDLQKYFFFSLGKEVKTSHEQSTTNSNIRVVRPSLAKDLTELTNSYEKEIENKLAPETKGTKMNKMLIAFLGKNFNEDSSEWKGDKLDKQITNNKEWYIVFEKKDNIEKVYFSMLLDEWGEKKGLAKNNTVFLKMEAPTTHIFKNKFEALKFLKENDPILQAKN